jgi:phytol kinase
MSITEFIFDSLLACGPVFILLILSEYLWRKKLLRGEYARKLVHIGAGSYICYWPYFISFRTISIIAVALVSVLALSKKIELFHAVHAVRKKSFGDILYPFSVMLLSLFTDKSLVFSCALAYMVLADGMAAVIGNRLGKNYMYQFMGNRKSLPGTLGFLIIAFGISLIYGFVSGEQSVYRLLLLPLVASIFEHISPRGTDNLTIPLTALLFFR